MARTKVRISAPTEYVVYRDHSENDIVIEEGVLVGRSPNQQNPGTENYEFRMPDGSFKGLYNTHVLDMRMSNVKIGDCVDVTYLGKKDPKKESGRPYHDFSVEKYVEEGDQALPTEAIESAPVATETAAAPSLSDLD